MIEQQSNVSNVSKVKAILPKPNPKPKSKMKIFEAIKKQLLFLGMNSSESQNPFNWKITMGFLMIGLGILLNGMLIFTLETITLMDSMNFLNIISSLMLATISLATIVLQQTKLFKSIATIEMLINESKSISVVWA